MIDRILNGRYQITELIGRGGMAYVYKAKDLKLGRFVAVKVLRDEYTENEQFIKKFDREAQSAARLSHPNIVSVYDVGVDDNTYFIVMEYVDGITLKQYLNRKKQLDYKEATELIIDIAQALQCAHDQKIIHRDIKPHNILLTKDLVPKVSDFGIARAITSSTVTMPNQTMGSVHYISPEQARGGFIDARSDIYSLGITYYELVTGELPFDEESSVTIAIKHIREEITPPIEINPNIPQSVNDVILRMTQKKPEERYQSCNELVEELDELLINSKITAGISRTQKVSQETLFTNLDSVAPIKREVTNQDDLDEVLNQKKKSKKKIIIGTVVGVIAVAALIFGLYKLFGAKEIAVPDILNMTREEATSTLQSYNLKFEVEKETYSTSIEKDHIISQNPAKGSKIKEGKTVKVTMSLGIKKVNVPQVIGSTEADALKALESNGLTADVVREYNKNYAVGTVFNVQPAPGQEVSEKDKITLYVSMGVEKIKAPGLVGLTVNDANTRIQANELTIGSVTEEYSSTYEAGVIMSQSPAEGVEVQRGDAISYVVSKGKKADPENP